MPPVLAACALLQDDVCTFIFQDAAEQTTDLKIIVNDHDVGGTHP